MAAAADREIVIPLSKRKLLFGLVLCLLFVALSGWLWNTVAANPRFDPVIVRIVCILVGFLAGLGGTYSCIGLFDKKPGLILDNEGIVDNSSGVATGRIPWHEITGFKITEISHQKFLTILVQDSEPYIERSSRLRRLVNAANAAMIGSPINISSNALQIRFDELVELVTEAFAHYQMRLEQTR
jgi:hypothetical protein